MRPLDHRDRRAGRIGSQHPWRRAVVRHDLPPHPHRAPLRVRDAAGGVQVTRDLALAPAAARELRDSGRREQHGDAAGVQRTERRGGLDEIARPPVTLMLHSARSSVTALACSIAVALGTPVEPEV